jgi:hypothetical protein
MACFLAPTAAAIIINAVKKRISPKYHVEWLLAMLWGGILWLIPEHIYHGEVVFYPPFFTAGLAKIIPEILTVGLAMVLASVTAWLTLLVAVKYSNKITYKPNLLTLMFIGAILMILVDKMFA